MKFFYLALLFCFSPIVQVNATTPKSVTCTRTEYREEYIPGTKSNPGYVKSYEVDVVIPCGGQSTAEKIDDNDCSEGSVIGGLLDNWENIFGINTNFAFFHLKKNQTN